MTGWIREIQNEYKILMGNPVRGKNPLEDRAGNGWLKTCSMTGSDINGVEPWGPETTNWSN